MTFGPLDMDVDVGKVLTDGSYPTRVLQSGAGEAQSTLVLPDHPAQLAATAAMLLDPKSADRSQAEALGTALFQALFTPPFMTLYRRSLDMAEQQGQSLRLRLRLSSPELALVPWELLFDSDREQFLVLDGRTSFVRYLERPLRSAPLQVPAALRILGLGASPSSQPPLRLDLEQRHLTDALRPLGNNADLLWEDNPTWQQITKHLRTHGPWHILHIAAHGEVNADGIGHVVLVDEEGEAQRFDAIALADMLADHPPLRLVVLNACQGARETEAAFGSMAHALVVRGVPAVIAMQHPIGDRAARVLIAHLYQALAENQSLEAALLAARKAVRFAVPSSFEWATPVLYFRSRDGHLFATSTEEGAAPSTVNTGGGDVAGQDSDKRTGVFVKGLAGAVIGTNSGPVNNYAALPAPAPAATPPSVGAYVVCYVGERGATIAEALVVSLTQLPHPFSVWLDTRDADPASDDYDAQTVAAIKHSLGIVVVSTNDAYGVGSSLPLFVKETIRAKKPLVVVQDGAAPTLPQLAHRSAVVLGADVMATLAEVKHRLDMLTSAQGVLDQLQERHRDAELDLKAARDPRQKARIEADLLALEADIARQQVVVAHEEQERERTRERIDAAIAREQQPERPISGVATTKFINRPPASAPTYFQGRVHETAQIGAALSQGARRLITVVGRGGVGKTALTCRLLKALEAGKLPDDGGTCVVDGIVYLSAANGSVNGYKLFTDLAKLLPQDVQADMEALARDPGKSPQDQMLDLLDQFPTGRTLVLLDNIETLIDPTTFALTDLDLADRLKAILTHPEHGVRVILTTRFLPRDLAQVQPGRQTQVVLDEGLPEAEAVVMLRALDDDGRVGLRDADEERLTLAAEHTRGFPRALEALYGVLAADRSMLLEDVLKTTSALPPQEVVETLVGEAFLRLDPLAQQVMTVLAVFGQAVGAAAVDDVLQPTHPTIDTAPILRRLVNMHLVRTDDGRFALHPIDRAFALTQLPRSNDADWSYGALTERAADYYRKTRRPRSEWKTLADLHPHLAEIDLRLATGDGETAADVLEDIDFEYLQLWGYAHLSSELNKRVLRYNLSAQIKNARLMGLGNAYHSLGRATDAINLYQQALIITREIGDRQGESAHIGNLGNAYARLGRVTEAIGYYQQALTITREIGDRQGEGAHLGNLADAYFRLGRMNEAIDYYQQALIITREIGDQRGEGATLSGLGGAYANLGRITEAVNNHQQALIISREIGNRQGEEIALGNLGYAYFRVGRMTEAINNHQQALIISREIGDRQGEEIALGNLGYAYSRLGQVTEAINHYQQQLLIVREIGDRCGESITLVSLGELSLASRDPLPAQVAYIPALVLGDEVSFPPVQSFGRWGLALTHLLQQNTDAARSSIEAATTFDVPEYNHMVHALHGLIALSEHDRTKAQTAWTVAISTANDLIANNDRAYEALDSRGLAYAGLAILGNSEHQVEAIVSYKQAREIAPYAGVVQRTLLLLDLLRPFDENHVLDDIRVAAAGPGNEA